MSFFQSTLGTVGSTLVTLGLDSEISRAMAFGSIGFLSQYLFRPSISYVKLEGKEGKPIAVARPFTLLSKGNENVPSTYFPWYFFPFVLALIGAVFL